MIALLLDLRIFFRPEVFTQSALHAAISRVKSPEHLKIGLYDDNINNIVFKMGFGRIFGMAGMSSEHCGRQSILYWIRK